MGKNDQPIDPTRVDPTNYLGTVVSFDNLDENAEIIGGENYIGDLPPARKALPGQIRRVYLTATANDDPILKVLYEVTDGRYTGFTAWDNVTLTNKAAFKWKPMVDAMGITVQDLIRKTRVDPNQESQAGLRVIAIGDLDLSGDYGVPVFFGVLYSNFDGIQQIGLAGVKPRRLDIVTTPNQVPAGMTNGAQSV